MNQKALIFIASFLTILIVGSSVYSAPGGNPGKPGGAGSTLTTECSDKIDNDGDGFCDYDGCQVGKGRDKILLSADIKCSIPNDTSEFDGSCFPTNEVCDGIDNNCDELIDEGSVCPIKNYYCDADNDSYRSKATSGSCNTYNCVPIGCSITTGQDCNDSINTINPGVTEQCDQDGIDNDCDSQIDECSLGTSCKELFPGTNNASADRVNVIFVATDYTNKEKFINNSSAAIDYYGNITSPKKGLMELEPYLNKHDKINFWYIDQLFSAEPHAHGGCTNAASYNYCNDLPNSHRVFLCEKDFRAYAYFGGDTYIGMGRSYTINNWPNTFTHEFQHQVPRLADEYVDATIGSDRPLYPNCADSVDLAQSWWGDLIGQTSSDGLLTGLYDGCSYVNGNYRATNTSIMRDGGEQRFGLPNTRYINQWMLTNYSNTPVPALENLVEVTLSGSPENPENYKVVDIKSVKNLSQVKKGGENKIELKAGNQIFDASFDTYDYITIENFDSKHIEGELKVVGKNIIKVVIPIGQAKFNDLNQTVTLPDQSKTPFTIKIRPQEGSGTFQ